MTLTICQYCQGNFVYSDGEEGELITGTKEDGILRGVYDELIRVAKDEDKWFLFYSAGANEDGVHDIYPIGAPINYCPNCGRKLN